MSYTKSRFENKISKQTNNIYINIYTHTVMRHLMTRYVLRNASLGDFVIV